MTVERKNLPIIREITSSDDVLQCCLNNLGVNNFRPLGYVRRFPHIRKFQKRSVNALSPKPIVFYLSISNRNNNLALGKPRRRRGRAFCLSTGRWGGESVKSDDHVRFEATPDYIGEPFANLWIFAGLFESNQWVGQ